jgi:hypothetical protein
LQEHVREAAGRGTDVEAHLARRFDPERVERRGELVTATADIRLGRRDLERCRRVDEIARLPVRAGGVALARAHATREHEDLSTRPRGREPALHEELVETDAGRSLRDARPAGHAPIVA